MPKVFNLRDPTGVKKSRALIVERMMELLNSLHPEERRVLEQIIVAKAERVLPDEATVSLLKLAVVTANQKWQKNPCRLALTAIRDREKSLHRLGLGHKPTRKRSVTGMWEALIERSKKVLNYTPHLSTPTSSKASSKARRRGLKSKSTKPSRNLLSL
jgi:hypothetical protein